MWNQIQCSIKTTKNKKKCMEDKSQDEEKRQQVKSN